MLDEAHRLEIVNRETGEHFITDVDFDHLTSVLDQEFGSITWTTMSVEQLTDFFSEVKRMYTQKSISLGELSEIAHALHGFLYDEYLGTALVDQLEAAAELAYVQARDTESFKSLFEFVFSA